MTAPTEVDVPRVAPGTRRQLGPVNAVLLRAIQLGARTANPPNLFATLGRHRGLFRRWLLFAGALMPGGKLPRADTELVILRVAHLGFYDATDILGLLGTLEIALRRLGHRFEAGAGVAAAEAEYLKRTGAAA